MAKATPATQSLQRAGVSFELIEYDYDPDAARIGLQAAEAIGEDPARVFKTLMTEVDGKPVAVILPSDQEVSMKKLAAAAGGKSAAMMKPAQAEKMTGYVVGGISPFGQRKPVPTVLDASASHHDRITINGGRRGLQVRLDPHDVGKAIASLVIAAITA